MKFFDNTRHEWFLIGLLSGLVLMYLLGYLMGYRPQ